MTAARAATRLRRSAFAACALALATAPAAAFTGEDDNTPGAMATAFRKQSNVWLRFDGGFVDARVTSTPPDSTKLDRRFETLAIAGFDAAFAGRWGVRANFKGEVSKRRQSESAGPRADVDATVVTYSPSADVTFVTDKGLEIFGGLQLQQHPGYTETVSSVGAESKTKFKAASVLARRFGVLRRAGPWSGGFYYVQGSQEERAFEQTASDGSSFTGVDRVFVPSRVSVFGEIETAPMAYEFELAFVQARGMGPRDENNTTVFTDYFEARVDTFWQIAAGLGVEGAVFHKTLSYANNAYVTVETIPITSIKLLGVVGERKRHIAGGLIYAFGKDGQSLPEFNATYETKAFALTLGLISPL